MSSSRAIVRSRSEAAVRRKPRNSTKNKPRTISTAGAACDLRIPRKLTSIGPKTIRWAAGTAPVGIGIRITAVTPTFREMESSTARSAGVSIRPSSLSLLRLASLATSTMILMTFVTLKVESAVTGVTLVIGEGTLVVGRIVRLTTTSTSVTAPTMGLTIPAAAAWATSVAKAFAVAKAPMVAEAFMVAKAFMAAKAPMVVEAFTVAEAVTVAAGAGAAIAKTGSYGNADKAGR